jgi:indole-3-glycerol phosphate synthase
LEEKRREIAALQGLSVTEVQPSRRDFTLFVATQKTDIALIPRLKRVDPETRGTWPDLDPVALARAYDDTEAAAIAVGTAAWNGGSLDDLERVSRAVTAIFPVTALGEAELRELIAVARSLHMAPIVEVESDKDLPTAAALAPALIGLRTQNGTGFADLGLARALAERIPKQRTVLLLSEVRELESLRELQGSIDAAVVGDALLDHADPAACLAAFVAGEAES